jgi:hypothetical protein
MKQRINSLVLFAIFSIVFIFSNCIYAQAGTVTTTEQHYPEGCVAATWNTDDYGSLISYSSGGNTFNTHYQCVELYRRWVESNLQLTYHPQNAKHLGEAIGDDPDYTVYWNGNTTKPVPGDALIWTNSGYGHVAIVTSVSGNTIHFIQQNDWWTHNNTFHPTGHCTWNGNSFSNPNDNIDSSQSGKCWIHPKKIGSGGVDSAPPEPTEPTEPESMRAFELVRKVSQPGMINVFYPADDGTLTMSYKDTDSEWNTVALCGGGLMATGPVSAVERSDGKVGVYYHNKSDHEMHECWRDPEDGTWTDWSTGIPIEDGTTAFYADGVTHVFYHSPGSAPELQESYHNDSGWHHHSLGRWVQGTPFALKCQYDGVNNVFYHNASDHKLHFLWWSASGWKDHNSNMPIYNSPVAVEAMIETPTNARGTMRVYYTDTSDDHLLHEYSWNPETNTWSDFNMGRRMTGVSVANAVQDTNGSVHVFYSDREPNPPRLYELLLDEDDWQRTSSGLVGGEISMSDSPFAVVQPSGNISVIIRDSESGRINEILQDKNSAAGSLNEFPSGD